MDDGTGDWDYPQSVSVLEKAGLFEIEVYIQRRRDAVFNFVKNQEIYQGLRRMWKTVTQFTGGGNLLM